MTQRQLFTTAVRVFGVYLLVQAVTQLPVGIVNACLLVRLWFASARDFPPIYLSVQEAVGTALLSFALYVFVGGYLTMGAPHLMKRVHFDEA